MAVTAGTASATLAAARVRITEVFFSIQGESTRVGLPTVFVRLTGCPLRCTYCDTAYAFTGGTTLTVAEVLGRVEQLAPPGTCVCVTGGEPLAQRGALALLSALCDRGFRVSLETSGAIDVAAVDPRVMKVVDLKTPGSGEQSRNLYANLDRLGPQDQVKFVILDRTDYEWSRAQVLERGIAARCEVLFSPSMRAPGAPVPGAGGLAPASLAEWILADRLPVRLQIQLHKVMWGDEPGR
ncbi:MAG: 7-carboxy-7-deazaguanine synthase QueE [Gammaproteobacteria bacterium]